MINNIAVLVIGYDGYSDLWEDFFNLFEANWHNNLEKFFVNEKKEINDNNFFHIKCGNNIEWTSKILRGLEEIKSDYIFLLLEDFFVGNKVNKDHLHELVNYISINDIDYMKLVDNNTINYMRFGNKVTKKKYLLKLDNKIDYSLSLQPSIWKKSFLKELIGDTECNAWAFESKLNSDKLKKAIEDKKLFFDTRNLLKIKHAVIQGKMIPSTVRYFKKKGYTLKTKRNKLNLFENIIFYIKKIISGVVSQQQKKYIKKALNKMFNYRFVTDKNKE
jgi:hypothetical protein